MSLFPPCLKLAVFFLALALLSSADAQAPREAYREALAAKAQCDMLLSMSSKDLADYCINNGWQARTLSQLSSGIARAEADLQQAVAEGFRAGNPKVDNPNAIILTKRRQFDAEIRRIRAVINADRTAAIRTIQAIEASYRQRR